MKGGKKQSSQPFKTQPKFHLCLKARWASARTMPVLHPRPQQPDHPGDPTVSRTCLQQLMCIKVSSAALTSLLPCRSVSLRILLPPSACLGPSLSLS